MTISEYIFGFFVILHSSQLIHTQSATACAGVPSGNFIRNPESCRAYYYCSNGIAHPNQCPDGYLFEPVRQICDVPSRVQCTGCSLHGIQHIAHPTDCSSYYECVSGTRTLRTCPQNLMFDRSVGDCNAASTTICFLDNTQICSGFSGFIRIVDPNDCSKFYTCLHGIAYHQSCAPGLFFKAAIDACTFPEEVDFCQL